MGGYYSGRTGWRAQCENLLSIDVRRWARGSYLSGGYFGWQWTRDGERISNIGVWGYGDRVELGYTKDGEKYRYPVYLTHTPCHLGGQRVWFLCPLSRCQRRAAKLYLGNQYFACRRCYRLAYACQSETRWDRAQRAANKIAARLVEDPQGNLLKPKRMRWKTFERLLARFRRYDDWSMEGVDRLLSRLGTY